MEDEFEDYESIEEQKHKEREDADQLIIKWRNEGLQEDAAELVQAIKKNRLRHSSTFRYAFFAICAIDENSPELNFWPTQRMNIYHDFSEFHSLKIGRFGSYIALKFKLDVSKRDDLMKAIKTLLKNPGKNLRSLTFYFVLYPKLCAEGIDLDMSFFGECCYAICRLEPKELADIELQKDCFYLFEHHHRKAVDLDEDTQFLATLYHSLAKLAVFPNDELKEDDELWKTHAKS